MRITGGKARGIQLKCPAGNDTRPAADSVREAVFSSLGNIDDLSVLDLFAGTGSYGLEALSRGAKDCLFLEQSKKAILALQDNIKGVCKSIGANEITRILKVDVLKWLKTSNQMEAKYHLIFMDPPYALTKGIGMSCIAQALDLLQPKGTLILESSGDTVLPEITRYTVIKTIGKKKGLSPMVTFWERTRSDDL